MMEEAVKKEVLPLAFNFGGNPGGNLQTVYCPLCEGSNVHVYKDVEAVSDKEAYEASGDHIGGDLISIPSWCESCDKDFFICLGFHKGYTYVFCKEAQE